MDVTISLTPNAVENNEPKQQLGNKKRFLYALGASLGVIGIVGAVGVTSTQVFSNNTNRVLLEEVAQGNDNGLKRWGGKFKIVNNLPQVCTYEAKSITWFTPNGQGSLAKGENVEFGPFGGYYTLGVQENVFARCAYAGTCAWNNHAADNYCFNFNVDSDCKVTQNDCPFPAGRHGINDGKSAAPDGSKRYKITGEIDNGVCKLKVDPTGDGPYFCSATLG
ncbi:hypothetical protein THRCLA_05610 [Thraustotheca clavata]|uniref:Uncharacterized protein n=1 Tax=Thraustotheca clavata TaxID=74557 RepID=A0A1V9ZVB9_9STRA|nr:hypothetical protein THRCLA_05610 [Thraustotheca clavata]